MGSLNYDISDILICAQNLTFLLTIETVHVKNMRKTQTRKDYEEKTEVLCFCEK
jgi:hypothetical protein